MAITVTIYYSGKNGNAKKFAVEMTAMGIVDEIRREKGNIRYEYFLPIDDQETLLLIDSWTDQEAIDRHHNTPMMQQIIALREKYDLHMKVERYVSDDLPTRDTHYIRE